MRSSIALRFFLLALCAVGNDSFIWSKPFEKRRTYYYAKDKDSSPHPPANPPPESLLDKSGAYFASSEEDASEDAIQPDPVASPPTPTGESEPSKTTEAAAAASLWLQANLVSLQK
jgi:hypothetical protein